MKALNCLHKKVVCINPPEFTPFIVKKYAFKTRTGFIPNMKKINQDSYFVEKDFADIRGLWLAGVMDGHGLQGHLVSLFCKKNF